MKKTILFLGLFFMMAVGSTYAQRYALIDMEYILTKIPSYEDANKQLESISKEWQKEVDAKAKDVEGMYKKYQADLGKLNATQKTARENAIVAKEKEVQTLRNKYFGPKGELMKRREEFIKPFQNDIYNAVKEISARAGYKLVIDRASANAVIFASPEIDISDQVLAKLGY